MKKFLAKMGPALAVFALFITTYNVNSTCALFAYQPKLPQAAGRLSKVKSDGKVRSAGK